MGTKTDETDRGIILILYIFPPNELNGGNFVKLWNCSDNRERIKSLWILVSIWDIGNILIKTRCKRVNNVFWKKNKLEVFWKPLRITSIHSFHLVICSDIFFPWNMICWQPYTSIYTASTFSKNSYIKTLISLQPCSISYNLSQGVFRRSKYSSGVVSINFLHSDSLASVLTANLTCSLSMGLIEQGIVSDYKSDSPISSFFIYLFKITSILF